jgi:hypothetical protein
MTKAADAIAEALACTCDLFQRNPLLHDELLGFEADGLEGAMRVVERLEGAEPQVDDFRPGISFAEFPEFVHSHNWHDPQSVCAFADFLCAAAEQRALNGKMRTALDTIRSAAGWLDEQRASS